MNTELDFWNIGEKRRDSGEFEVIRECPMCHKVGKFDVLYACAYEESAATLHFCPACDRIFSVTYQFDFIDFMVQNRYPAFAKGMDVPKYVQQLSPQFLVIYEQALRAEENDLDQIAGPGYRKALEFLVKDYAISKNPSSAEKIKQVPLGNCIETFIEHSAVKELVKRAAWLGNDYTHYLKKHTDCDLSDLKELISLTMQWINIEIQSAKYKKEIQPKK